VGCWATMRWQGHSALASNNHGYSELSQLFSVAMLAIPALGIVVVDPLMGLVDTACIGRTSTEQLTALAPNSAVFNMMFQVWRVAFGVNHM
jgi:Na+-driven multidrug efflux pump